MVASTPNPEARPKKKRVHVEVSQRRLEVIEAPRIITEDGRAIDQPTSAEEDDSATARHEELCISSSPSH